MPAQVTFLSESTSRDIGQFLTAEKTGTRSRATWRIKAKRGGAVLGRAEWYEPWSQYVLIAPESVVWSSGCLRDVARFMDALKKEGG